MRKRQSQSTYLSFKEHHARHHCPQPQDTKCGRPVKHRSHTLNVRPAPMFPYGYTIDRAGIFTSNFGVEWSAARIGLPPQLVDFLALAQGDQNIGNLNAVIGFGGNRKFVGRTILDGDQLDIVFLSQF